jgi:hypothetical protein
LPAFVADVSVEAVDVLLECNTLVEGNLLEFELEGQRTRQRYICVQHVCHYAAFRPLGAAAAADGDQECRDAPLDMHIAFQNGLTHFTVENMCAYNIVAEK